MLTRNDIHLHVAISLFQRIDTNFSQDCKMAADNHHRDEYQTFDPVSYLDMRYRKTTDHYRFSFPLQMYHEFFQRYSSKFQRDSLNILEYGCGPVIMYLISAAPYAREIVMADKVPRCLDEVRKWIDSDKDAFDWSLHFNHVVQKLEGSSEKAARERETEVQRKVHALVNCDIFEDSPIQNGYEGPYDIVMSNVCIDGACKNVTEFEMAVKKLAELVKPGGIFTIMTNSFAELGRCCTYGVGESADKFPSVSITREFLISTLESAGFTDLHIDGCDRENLFREAMERGLLGSWAVHQPEDFLGFIFIHATKK